MDLVYSCSLLISLAAASLAVLIGVLAIIRNGPASSLLRAGLSAVGLSAIAVVVSVVVHWRWGHGPTSVEPMGVVRFVGSHTAFAAAGIAIAAGLAAVLYARSKTR